ncbi:hypothetical protein RXV86_02740 [Alisedimentitalea sp. MJ-SS2]|uniref:hypothetical protein n=1 Tax=Aliisedimentitalea sp. MJ-SS2 TaxID=3049795 RepID=UPI00290E555E|nr:hypothetical protein [Alisedimentitalea sp. MJ-SS2]MDU8926292.1 hypothetical protein [Alisedimentitalea sp. MJ-SS2]
MNETSIMILLLALPLAAAWAVNRTAKGALRWLVILPLVMFVINLGLTLTDLTCEGGGDTPWTQCSIPALGAMSNGLVSVYFYNLLAIMAITPAMLILSGISVIIRRERHKT